MRAQRPAVLKFWIESVVEQRNTRQGPGPGQDLLGTITGLRRKEFLIYFIYYFYYSFIIPFNYFKNIFIAVLFIYCFIYLFFCLFMH